MQKGNNGNIVNVLSVFEMILCFDAWINQIEFWPSTQNTKFILSASESIQKMMKYIKLWLPETAQAQGWKNPKFHFLTYFVNMIVCYIAPKKYYSQCQEHNHK